VNVVSFSEDAALAYGWGTRVSIFQPRKPASWLYALLLVYGALSLVALFAPRFAEWPVGSVLALCRLTAYTIPIAAYINHLDLFEHEPAGMLAGAFLWGGLIATALALSANRAVEDMVSKLLGPEFSSEWSAAIAGPADEETSLPRIPLQATEAEQRLQLVPQRLPAAVCGGDAAAWNSGITSSAKRRRLRTMASCGA